MNTQQFRQSLKLKWLNYYQDNREWLVELGVWISHEGQRRPSSSFILATVTVLEPRLPQLMPIVVGLSSNPDRVVKALGLDFSPDAELEKAIANGLIPDPNQADEMRLLPPGRAARYGAADHTLEFEPKRDPRVSHPVESPVAMTVAVDAVDLYLDQEQPHQVAAAQDEACCGVGGREPFGSAGRDRTQERSQSKPQGSYSHRAAPTNADKPQPQSVAQSQPSSSPAPSQQDSSNSHDSTTQTTTQTVPTHAAFSSSSPETPSSEAKATADTPEATPPEAAAEVSEAYSS